MNKENDTNIPKGIIPDKINEQEKLSFILDQAKQGVEPKILEHNMRVFGFSEQFIERILLDDEV